MEYFTSEDKCVEYFQAQRWAGDVVCPHCDHEKVYRFSDGKRFKCAGCKRLFNVKTGTIFEDSKLPLRKWFVAIHLVTCHKKGISSHQLARDIKVTQRTAWFMLQRIRHQLGVANDPDEQIDGVIEVDETFVGGKNKNRHRDKKVEKCQGRSFKDKTPILGIMQRGGIVKTIVVPNTNGDILKPLIEQIVAYGSRLISDEWQGYRGLNAFYQHEYINHGIGQYADGDIHTNTIEGFWPWIKRSIMGVYHYVSRKHLQLYANEATFRYNTRNLPEGSRLQFVLTEARGSIKYKQLIAA